MNYFKLGTNFDPALPHYIAQLNSQHQDKAVINEVYGSDRAHANLAARPDFRLPNVSMAQLEYHVRDCHAHGICFNYTMNTILPGSKVYVEEHKAEIIDFIHKLEDIGVYRVTAASPLLMEIIREASPTIELDISTIMHVDTVTQIQYLHETFGIKKLCNSVLKNRSVNFLMAAAKYCNANDIEFELLANEFCGVAGKSYTTHCVYRDSCYITHAQDTTKESAMAMDTYPMQHCATGRAMDMHNWLKLRWIRPQDLHYYNSIGIDKFKITGRTGSTDYIMRVAEGYMSGVWDDNLLDLWKPLETIYTGQAENEYEQPAHIDTKLLDKFLFKWFNEPGFDCANELCGTDCNYCEHFYTTKVAKAEKLRWV